MSYCEPIIVLGLLILPFLYDLSEKCRYYFRFALFYTILMVNSVILIPWLLYKPFERSNIQ